VLRGMSDHLKVFLERRSRTPYKLSRACFYPHIKVWLLLQLRPLASSNFEGRVTIETRETTSYNREDGANLRRVFELVYYGVLREELCRRTPRRRNPAIERYR